MAGELKRLTQQKEQIQKRMIQIVQGFPSFDILVSFPRICPLTAVLLIAELGDIQRFPVPRN